MASRPIKSLYYIAHVENVPSILQRGILSHDRVEKEQIRFTRIYDESIVTNRRDRKTPDGRSLWSFANLYFQPRNAMLYRVIHEKSTDNIVILAVRPDILNRADFISIGNAASYLSDILPRQEGQKAIPHIRGTLSRTWWTEEDGSKRIMMAECLVPDVVPPGFIQSIYVADHEIADGLKSRIGQEPPVIPEPRMFFQPVRKIQLTPQLYLVEGDMFFSKMQTLTISVNCVGVMGKGLASRAKYQFPDAYVKYQDVCRGNILQMGKPYLYKRETLFDYQLADDPATLSEANLETWFLLFPTKRHWRERSDFQGIERGLQWIQDNYQREEIKSLAVPALGCGLGRLKWRDVGPLLCRYLSALDIPVWVHLPVEEKLPDELLSRDFLLETTS